MDGGELKTVRREVDSGWSKSYSSYSKLSRGVRHGASRLGVQDFEIHWISRGFRISDWISGFHVDFWISKWISVFHVDFWISKWISGFHVDFRISKWISTFWILFEELLFVILKILLIMHLSMICPTSPSWGQVGQGWGFD